MPVQVNIFLLLFGALQGVFLSIVLLQKKVHKAGYGLLVLYLTVMVLQMTLKVMSKVWLMSNLDWLYTLSYHFPLLYGPLLFLFTKRYFFEKKFKAYELLHFLPFAAVILFLSFENYIEEPSFFISMLFSPVKRLVVELASVIIYHWFAYRNWRLGSINQNALPGNGLRSGWIKRFIIASFIACTLIVIVICYMFLLYPVHQEIRFGFTALAVFVYWISYSAWTHPQLFASKDTQDGPPKALILAPALTFYSSSKKYSNSGLCIEEEKRIINRLDELMERRKLFLQPDITIDRLATEINCSRHHLSQVLNACIQKSFYDYINFYRVEEVKGLLIDDARINHKIASIAYDAGFNSLSTFNEVFKKFTGTTPSQYRRRPPAQSRRQRV